MTKRKLNKLCPSCGEEDSLTIQGNECVCSSVGCGRSFTIDLTKPPGYKTKSKTKKKAK